MEHNFGNFDNNGDMADHDEEQGLKLDILGQKMQENIDEDFIENNVNLTQYKPSQRRLHPLMLQLIDHNISCKFDLLSGSFFVEGFYKNGDLELQEAESGELYALDKKGNQIKIESFEALVLLNYEYWKLSGGRNGNYSPLTKPWLDEFVDRGLVKRQVTYAPS